jgi:hypothetical protein
MSTEEPKSTWRRTTPSGHIERTSDGPLRAFVRMSIRNKDAVMAAVKAVAALTGPPFLRCSGSQQQDAEGVWLTWPAPAGRLSELTGLVPAWRREPARYFTLACDVVQCVRTAASELDHIYPLRFLLSPAQAFLHQAEGGGEQWTFLPLPVEGASFHDFATASEDASAWLAGDDLLRGAVTDRAYIIGAALYYCLVGDTFVSDLAPRPRVQRKLLNLAGNAKSAQLAFAAALPKSLAGNAESLSRFVMTLLTPSFGRPITPAQAVHEFERMQTELSAPRLAAAWQAEGATARALSILERFAHSAPKADVPWDLLARLREDAGDRTGAAAARRNIARSPQEEEASLVQDMRVAAALGVEGRAELERGVARLRSGLAGKAKRRLSDETFLYLVYVNTALLGNTDESLQLLKRDFAVSWHAILKAILMARLSASRSDWIEVGRCCRDARQGIGRLPDRGSRRGRYALAYVDLLDGLAHMGAVDAGQDSGYLIDAFEKLQAAWSGMQEFQGNELEPPILAAFARLAQTALAQPKLATLASGVRGFCLTVGIPANTTEARLAPPVPWIPERALFG